MRKTDDPSGSAPQPPPEEFLHVQQEIIERKTMELKRAGEELEEIREKHRGLSEAAFESIFFSEKGICIEQNKTAEEMFGYTSAEAIGRYGTEWIVPADRAMVMDNMLAGYEEPYQVTALRKDGSTFPCMLKGKMMFYNGKVVRVTSLADITERKQAEEALNAIERRFSLLMDFLPALVFIKDAESRMIYSNDAMDVALGASAWGGKLIHELFDAETAARILADDQKTLEEGYQKIEESFLNLDGKIHHYITQKFIIPIAGQPSLLGGIALDITKRRQAEEESIKAREEAEKANIAKSEFLSRMSHELRTPMNSILGFAQLMELDDLSQKQRKGVSRILASGRYLLQLIDEVLDISCIEAGGLMLLTETVHLDAIIQEMIDIVQPLALDRQLTMDLMNSPSGLLFVEADSQRLKQVLLNLLSNAIKYNWTGGSVHVETRVMPENETGTVPVRISVTNTGAGITPEDIRRIFNPFERVGAEKTEVEGTGLGLTVVKKLMEAMGGTTGAESIPGEATTFWIELPMSRVQKSIQEQEERYEEQASALIGALEYPAPRSGEKPKQAAELVSIMKDTFLPGEAGLQPLPAVKRNRTILYIEDNIPNAELVASIIEAHRPETQLISSMFGKYAFEIAVGHSPDLILLDLDLPDMHGIEVLIKLQADERTRYIPVVIISADATPHQEAKLLAAGARGYLTKPFDIIIFLNMMDEWLGKRPFNTGIQTIRN